MLGSMRGAIRVVIICESQSMRYTIRDVARRAGVSVGTVSRVVNGDLRVQPDNRLRVMQAIAELGYRPDAVARSLVARGASRPTNLPRSDAPRLVTVGFVSMDLFIMMDAMPNRGARNQAKRMQRCLGGPAANVAVAAAGLGGRWRLAVDLISSTGDDAESDWALARLIDCGVSVEGISRLPKEQMSRTVILVEPDATRTILNEDLRIEPRYVADHLRAFLARDRPVCLHLEGYRAPLAVALPSDLWQALTWRSLDTSGLADDLLDLDSFCALTRQFDIAFLSLRSLRALLGSDLPEDELVTELDAALRARGALSGCRFAVQLGPARAALLEEHGRCEACAPLMQPVDTTGTGDVFVGLFLAAMLAGDPLDMALSIATRGAALSVTELGVNTVPLDAGVLTDIG